MTDTKKPGDKTLHVTSTKSLSIKRPQEQSVVRQSFSHGRSKAVVVEKVKRRAPSGPGTPLPEAKEAPPPKAAASQIRSGLRPQAAPPPASPSSGAPAAPQAKQQAGLVLRTLTDEEMGARNQALLEARRREDEDRRRAEGEARDRADREARDRQEREAAESRKRDEELRRRHEEDLKRRAEEEARRRLGPEPPRTPPPERSATQMLADRAGPGLRLDRLGKRPAPERQMERNPERAGAAPAGGGAAGGAGPRIARGPGRPGDGPRPFGSGPRPQGGAGRGPGGPGGGMRGPGAGPRGGAMPPANLPPAKPQSERGLRRPGTTDTAPPVEGDEDFAGRRPARRAGPVKPVVAPRTPRGGDERRRGRLTLTNALEDEAERTRSVAAFRRRMQRLTGHRAGEEKEKIVREVVIPETITIQELANRMSERAVDVIRFLMKQGQMAKITDVIDADTAQLIAEDLGHSVKRVAESDVEEGLHDRGEEAADALPRPPVVTIMGHVDHGKTSLLDAIRAANVAGGEAGGITQHIGAYQVTAPGGSKITFIDTPGHAAFTQMRARGARVTDIVVLVVAADDGVMPQTIEAINHAKAAKVPIIVAINKIDKPDAKPERVRTELLQYEVQVESLGGDVLDVEVSAIKKTNLDRLLDAIALQAEVLDLRADPDRPAQGAVIEAQLDRGRGAVATVLVQRGTLKAGDIVVAGSEWGKVRALIADDGRQIREAGPSVPVEVLGFNATPDAGDTVAVVESEARAREVTEYRARQKREKSMARQAGARASLADMMRDLKEGSGRKELLLVVKGDVQGSVEAISSSLDKLGTEEVRARVIHSGVGGITESDITLAEASKAIVIGFNVRAHKEARETAERIGIEIRYYNIIYDLVDDIKQAMAGLLSPVTRETRLGEARVLEVFNVSKVGKVAGCVVTDGTVQRGAGVRLIRDNVVIHEGKLSTLQRFKDAVQEVRSGTECGMSFENYNDLRKDDVIECFRVESVARTL
jgi:translation initiation factor IF-2